VPIITGILVHECELECLEKRETSALVLGSRQTSGSLRKRGARLTRNCLCFSRPPSLFRFICCSPALLGPTNRKEEKRCNSTTAVISGIVCLCLSWTHASMRHAVEQISYGRKQGQPHQCRLAAAELPLTALIVAA